mmetsp:Transcript_26874/g.40966  ORF Transcript_26874/g.40966 Transcript_26874/m.40966 type:complete len:145 (-) Transcript_26874:593-1027(-)
MDNFSTMVVEIRDFNKTHDDSERLSLFMGTLRQLNDFMPMDDTLEKQIYSYFVYRWHWDRNFAISTDTDYSLFEQLPGRIQTEIYVSFLFKEFSSLYAYKPAILSLDNNRFALKKKRRIGNRKVIKNHLEVRNALDSTKYYASY